MPTTIPHDPREGNAMLHLTVLGSGSGGNAAVVSGPDGHVLVDAGLSALQIRTRLESRRVGLFEVSAVLLTHEHGDHVRGLPVLLRQHAVPVYCNAHTRALVEPTVDSGAAWRVVETGSRFSIAGLSIESFSVPHDAVDPMGFVITDGRARLGILSDLGHVTRSVLSRLTDLDTLFVEANYCPDLLAADTKRPWSTRQRIASRHGHLSNHQAAELVASVATARLRRVVLGHLSRDCNCPVRAADILRNALVQSGFPCVEVVCAGQDEPTPAWPVADPPTRPTPPRMIQGELFLPELL